MFALENMTRADKLRLMEALWDDLSREPDFLQSPPWHGEALAGAELAVAEGNAEFVDWEHIKRQLRG